MSYFSIDSASVNTLKRLDFYIASRSLMDQGIFKPAHILIGYLVEFFFKDSIVLADPTLQLYDRNEEKEVYRHNLIELYKIIAKYSILDLEEAPELLKYIQVHQTRYFSEIKTVEPKYWHFSASFIYVIDHFILTLDKAITNKFGVENSILHVAKENWFTHGMKYSNNISLYRDNYHLLDCLDNKKCGYNILILR